MHGVREYYDYSDPSVWVAIFVYFIDYVVHAYIIIIIMNMCKFKHVIIIYVHTDTIFDKSEQSHHTYHVDMCV